MGGIVGAELSEFVHELPAELLEVIDRSGYEGEGSWRAGGVDGRRRGARARSGEEAPGAPRRYRSGAPGLRQRQPAAVPPADKGDGDRRVELDPDASWSEVVGMRVYHSKFGSGIVVGQEGHGADARLTVRFDGAVTKKVVARFLSLVEP
jgi:DNA helicase-2/ATP-dependent DNA helicase PcrA